MPNEELSSSQQRKPRFRREAEGHIQLTERDVAILQHVHRHRFLRSTHLLRLLDGGQGLIRRLGMLYHHQYLDRPREQIDFYAYAGSKPLVYAIGNKGADVLSQLAGIPRGKVDWTAKNREIGTLFLNHSLLVADFMVSLEVACRQRTDVRLIRAGEILRQAPEVTRKRKNPLAWSVSCVHEHTRLSLGVIPDQFFGLHFTNKPDGANRAYFFLEADRATMPVMRSDLKQTSFFRKMIAYNEAWKQQLHTDIYGIKNFRVLTLTSSRDRVDHLITANKKVVSGQGSKLFLFTDAASLQAADDPLTLGWRNGRDESLVNLV